MNARGEVFFNVPNSRTYRIGADGKPAVFLEDSKRGDGQAFGPDGRLYAVAGGAEQILAYDAEGKASVVAEGFRGNDLVVRHGGSDYVTEPDWERGRSSKVWLIRDGEKRVVDTGLRFSNGITLSPDQTLLYVADSRTHWVWSWQIQADGRLAHRVPGADRPSGSLPREGCGGARTTALCLEPGSGHREPPGRG